MFKKERVDKGNNSLWLEICGYRFTDSENDGNSNSITLVKTRDNLTKSYNKLSIIRLVKYRIKSNNFFMIIKFVFSMNNVVHAIRTEKQLSEIYLEKLQKYLEANKDYLLKTKERESRQLRIKTLKEYLDYQTYLYQQRLYNYQQKQRNLEERSKDLRRINIILLLFIRKSIK